MGSPIEPATQSQSSAIKAFLDWASSQDIAQPWDTVSHGTILFPDTAQQVAEILKKASDCRVCLAVNRKDAVCLEEPIWLNLSKLDQIVDYRKADFTLKLQSGMTVYALRNLLREVDHSFPLTYPDETMLADLVAEDRPALEAGFYGYPRDYVLALEVATPDGLVTKCGADVVKNVTGYDLNKLYTGSHHTLGVITGMTLKLAAVAERKQGFWAEYPAVDLLLEDVAKLLAEPGSPLCRCEIFQRERLTDSLFQATQTPWHLYVQLSGQESHVKAYEAQVSVLCGQAITLTRLPATQALIVCKQLSRYPESALVVELALPVGVSACTAFFEEIQQELNDYPGVALQYQPAAGLATVVLPIHEPAEEGEERSDFSVQSLLEAISEFAKSHHGFLQILQYPIGWEFLASRWNFPRDPVASGMIRRIKELYDPANVLFSRRLPFEVEVS
ncbi:MAG: FAD-binding oxidoreductase [Vampirovibrio sp.]|nr:FAD-binding oxidoreductase [Vampirovibrio sp.]